MARSLPTVPQLDHCQPDVTQAARADDQLAVSLGVGPAEFRTAVRASQEGDQHPPTTQPFSIGVKLLRIRPEMLLSVRKYTDQ